MAEDEETPSSSVLGLTAQIVSAHVSNNAVSPDALPLADPGRSTGHWPVSARDPASRIGRNRRCRSRNRCSADHIVCLEDGKKLKMLKRHLKTAYNMTPEQYRERWGLAPDYPMVAPDYARHRSSLAKKIGLGTKPRRTTLRARPGERPWRGWRREPGSRHPWPRPAHGKPGCRPCRHAMGALTRGSGPRRAGQARP